MNAFQRTAHRLNAWGFNTTAIRAGTKQPGHDWEKWQAHAQSLDDVNALPWRDASGVGFISGVGGLRGFDFDKCGDFGPVGTLLDNLGLPFSYPWLWRSGSGAGWGLAVLCIDEMPVGVLSTNGKGPGVLSAPGSGFDHLELRWRDCQTVLPPSRHPTGPGYVWLNGEPSAPPATVVLSQVLAAFSAVTVRPQPRPRPAPAPSARPAQGGYGAAALRNELDTLGQAVEGTRNDSLNRAAFALGQLVAGGELDRATVETALLSAAQRIGLDERETVATLRSGLDAGEGEPRTAPPPMVRPAPAPSFAPDPPAWLADAPETTYGEATPDLGLTPAPEPTPHAERFRLRWARDALRPQPPVDWIVTGLYGAGTVNLVFGEPGCKKTYASSGTSPGRCGPCGAVDNHRYSL